MPETVKREYTAQSKRTSASNAGRTSSPSGSKFPSSPKGSDGKYEHTAAGKTRRTSF